MKKITLLLSMLFLFASASWGQIISQYIETNSGTIPKGIEIWNNTASALDFSTNNLVIWKGVNGAAPAVDYTLSTGTLAADEVIVIGTSDLETITLANGSAFYLKAFTFNGDDALEVWYGGTKTDVFGDPGTGDPGTGWSGNGVQTYNQNIQLLSGITTGDTDGWTDPSIRFETVSTNPTVDGGVGFGIAPAGAGNINPVITGIYNWPYFPVDTESVTIYAEVTDSDGTLTAVELHWGTESGTLGNTINMSDIPASDTYFTDTDIPAQPNNTTVYYEIYAIDNDGGESTSPELSYSMPATTNLPYIEPFDDNLGACYDYSESGDTKKWLWNSGGWALCNGYNSGDEESDWLVLPAVNFDNYSDEVMTFDTWYRFGTGDDESNHYLKLFYSTDYQGTGYTIGNWTEIAFTRPATDQTWTSSGIIDLSGLTGTGYLAFRYLYADSYRLWQIDNIAIYQEMVDVTFQVDMSQQTILGDGVHLVGNFSPYYDDWDETALLMDDSDGDQVYTITLNLPHTTEFQYKFLNGSDWAYAENAPTGCQYPSTTNRYLTTGMVDETLDVVCYGLCTSCTPDSYDITFRVDMQNESVSGDGVYLAGTFTNWGTNAEAMVNTGGSIWEVTISLSELSDQEYKFVNGDPNNSGSWEGVSNRQLSVPSENTTLSLVCFNSYTACTPPQLIISEVALPYDNNTVQFIELYNADLGTIDFDSDIWYLCRQSNGGATWYDEQLVGSIGPGETYTNGWDEYSFNVLYAPLTLDQESYIMYVAGGDDGLFLYYGGDHTTGVLVDAFGVIDEDGTDMPWEYLGTKAVRLRWVDTPNATWQSWEWDIPEIAGSDQTTPGEHKSDVTWLGATDNFWFTKGTNWSGTYGYIPDASFNVTIADVANCYIFNPAACNNLTINTNAMLGIGTTIFDIYGNLDINTSGEFTLGADDAQNASVIVYGSATGDANVERKIQGWNDGANNGWHNISSPVNNMVLAGSNFEPGDNDDLYQWDEASNTWENYKKDHFTMFVNGRGYLNAFEFSGSKNFVGTLNTADVPITGLTKDGDGFHLLGNPFASALSWDNGNWNLSNIGAVAQIWDESNNSYAQLSAFGTIPPTNGFFVEVAAVPATLTIPKYARFHNIVDNYKQTEMVEMVETLDLRITNDENGFYDVCRVGFKDDATEEWDMQYDAHKLFGGSGTSQLWSVLDGENFVYNFIPYVSASYQLPVSFRAGVNATHHITVEGVDSFFGSSDIYLEDLQTEDIINLTEQPIYSFTASVEDAEERFILHFMGVNSVEEPILATNEAKIYSVNQTVYVRFNKLKKEDSQVKVFNTLGQQVYSTQLSPSTMSSFRLNEKSGIYIVRLQNENGLTTQKVMIK